MSDGGNAEIGMQRAIGLCNVVAVVRPSGDVLFSAVMPAVRVNRTADFLIGLSDDVVFH